jgi:hypothetical protein
MGADSEFPLELKLAITPCNRNLPPNRWSSLAWPLASCVDAMSKEDRRQFYMRKAKEAEDQAAKAKTDDLKLKWLKVAEDYRALARLT